MNIGERLLKLRKSVGLSQEEVANIIGVSRQTISKWETGESNPDFDKIIPLCNLYNISTDELIRGVTPEKKETIESLESKTKEETLKEEQDSSKEQEDIIVPRVYKRFEPLVVSISIFLYFVAVVWIIFIESLDVISDELMVSIFLLIAAIPTCILTYYYISVGNQKRYLKEQAKYHKLSDSDFKVKSKYKDMDDIIALVFTILYLYVSFTTGGWHITWILWIVYSLVIKIVHIILDAKDGKDNEDK